MTLFDATHTSHTRAQTGIQRVCRSLFAELARVSPVLPVCFDPHQHAWRALTAGELATLGDRKGSGKSRGAKWSLTQKIAGRARRLAGRKTPTPTGQALICPELFSGKVAARLPELFAQVGGPRVALFHDAIALKFPELTPPATVARMPGYLRELLRFDGIAAVSEDSAQSLRDFWQWLGVTDTPPVIALPLGVDPVPTIPAVTTHARPRVLCVSTIEGRKNHTALLEAADSLWSEGVAFELELIGMPRADTGAHVLQHIRQLQAAGRALVYHGTVTEDLLHEAYARSTLTIYPSLYEGFGLPVLESLQHGRPCLCSDRGALSETAKGGGVHLLPSLDNRALAASLRHFLQSPTELAALARQASERKFRSWNDYVRDLQFWMKTLPRRI
ncbi:MAG: glycosyltransferase [Candidatus Didemnitutus sp.]|nr:glycosyltransferase [Candidatus Didemnitutus sp.]